MIESACRGYEWLLTVLAAVVLLGAGTPARAQYQVTFTVNTELHNVFVSAHEWNGSVYAWDLFPIYVGTVPAGVSTFQLGNHNVVAWAIFGASGTSGMATGINDSLSALPVGATFASVFPGYTLSVVRSNTMSLYVNGAYNTQPGFALFDFVLTNEDTLKTDFATGTLHMFTFDTGVNVGTATISIAQTQPCCAADGSCTLALPSACAGTSIAGTTCTPTPCPQLTGACCTGTACSTTTQAACVGLYQGVGVLCGPSGNPTTCCPANFNGVGGLSVQDIFDFLGAWFAGDAAADFNGVNGLEVQDIFDFLGAWFAGC
jgi:hypothetical protein